MSVFFCTILLPYGSIFVHVTYDETKTPCPPHFLIQKILSELLVQIDLFEQWASHTARKRAHCEVWLTDKQWKDLIANRDRKRAIARMRKQKWIKDAQHGSKICVKITADAVIHELKNQIRRSDKQIPQAQLCLVLFDFPNGANLARQLWREFLLSAKFQRTQL